MNRKMYLATTGITGLWDFNSRILLLGPWCLASEKNKDLLKGKDYVLVSTPWRPADKIKEAADYCHDIYERLLPQLSHSLNSLHQVSYPVRYWRILIGPWLLYFVGCFYDRYKRIENVLEIFPDFYTYVLSRGQCKLAPFDMYDFFTSGINSKVKNDYYNLTLFSLIANDICPNNIEVKAYNYDGRINMSIKKYSWKRRLFNRLLDLSDLFFKNPIVLCDMFHLNPLDMIALKLKGRFNTFCFMGLESMEKTFLTDDYSHDIRNRIALNGAMDRFQSLLYSILPEAMPMSYVENYKSYRSSIRNIKNIDSVKIVGSAVAWLSNERFKFFASEAVSRGAKLVEFQHGGGYGTTLALPQETLSLEKDLFYTWGWRSDEHSKIRPLPSPHLSGLKETYLPKLDNIIFVGVSIPIYHYINHSVLLPDNMPKYFADKKIFFQALQERIRQRILYRPFIEGRWDERDIVKKIYPNIRFISKGRLVNWMKKVKLVVIDHSHTSFIEALTINCPCVFYWDHEVFLMRPEAEEYFSLLRDAGILFKDPLSAAKKVNEIFDDPVGWWLQDNVQDARTAFCRQYAYADKNWIKIWTKELKAVIL